MVVLLVLIVVIVMGFFLPVIILILVSMMTSFRLINCFYNMGKIIVRGFFSPSCASLGK